MTNICKVDERVYSQTQTKITALPGHSSDVITRDANIAKKFSRSIIKLDNVVTSRIVLA